MPGVNMVAHHQRRGTAEIILFDRRQFLVPSFLPVAASSETMQQSGVSKYSHPVHAHPSASTL
jgi:hypothetical protein